MYESLLLPKPGVELHSAARMCVRGVGGLVAKFLNGVCVNVGPQENREAYYTPHIEHKRTPCLCPTPQRWWKDRNCERTSRKIPIILSAKEGEDGND